MDGERTQVDLKDKRNVLIVNDNTSRPTGIRKRCYEIFLESRSRRLATQFGRTDWQSGNRQVGENNRTEMTVGKERKTVQNGWLLARANRFNTVHAQRYD